MNGYNYNYDPNDNKTDGQYAYSSQNGWYYYNGNWHRDPKPLVQEPIIQNQPPQKGGGKKALGVTSLVLACALAGFGGGYAAVGLVGTGSREGPAVVYKAPEGSGSAASPATSGEYAVSEIAATAGQSVVSISTENVVADFALGGRIVSGAGSGVIISEDGYIITNHHVIDGARSVMVALPDGTEHEAAVVGSDEYTDVAVLKINATGLVPAVLGDSDGLQVGEFCIAIGNPMGTLGGTVTDGIISALNRELTIENHSMNLLQMSAAVSPGNSGGGLFNGRGELVGIVNAKSDGNGAEGLGFAIPINTAMDVAEKIMESGYVTGRPAMGVTVMMIETEQDAAEVGVSELGLYIAQVSVGGGAHNAGLKAGDRILAIEGEDVTTSEQLSQAISEKEVGDRLELRVRREGQDFEVLVVLGELSRVA